MNELENIDSWLAKGVGYLTKCGVPEQRASVEFMMAEVLRCGRGEVAAGGARTLSWKQGNHFWEMVKKRGRRIPLAYVLESQPFAGLDIRVTPTVLIPRPETEQLVEFAVETARAHFPSGAPVHILEIGTGSGCVALALAKNLPGATIYATEISAPALNLAVENARALGLESRIRFLSDDLFKPKAVPKPWADMLVSNPPYIPTAELKGLSPEVLKEPVLALDGGKDGLDAIRAIVAEAPRVLKPGGWILLECADGQARKLSGIFAAAGFSGITIRNDLQGKERVAVARLQGGEMIESQKAY